MKSKYRECSQTHIRDYPECFEDCGLDTCEQSEKAKIAMPLVSEKEIESHYHKPSSLWLDKPDRAGDWWIYHKFRIIEQKPILRIQHLDTVEDANVLLDLGIKWLYIEQPEAPKE